MIQKINSTQNNMTFGRKLVAIKDYKGTPNLSQQAINGINDLRRLATRTDGDIIAVNGSLARNIYSSLDQMRLKDAIKALENHRNSFLKAIYKVKQTGVYKSDLTAIMENNISKILTKISDLCLIALKR